MSYDRPRSRGFFERDRHGHERIIFRSNSNSNSHRRSTSQPRTMVHELASDLEDRNAELQAVAESLKTEMAIAESRNWQLISDNSALRDIVQVLKGDKEILRRESEEKSIDIEYLEETVAKLEERVRLMRRGLTGRGILSEGGLKERLEDKVGEIERLSELLKVMDDKLSERNRWLAEKDNKLGQLKRWIVSKGFRVEGV
ncbi:uncharacterized protein EAE97_009876 [Botrytis byssoidea]|uniref:Uncharacterized protein n=1 Tax=Botrytis byssoidea TaxID=139641 RepID=A0A9P5I2I0_9HELO|nr:uncharacterized protein EAE97_009876 [Botrytis byssoidea]KAF7928078.1 hypothetical protein EAE97_009876 [Botrytis byssoidea]